MRRLQHQFNFVWYAGCLGLYPVISVKIHYLKVSQPEIAKNWPKLPILGFQGCSRSWN